MLCSPVQDEVLENSKAVFGDLGSVIIAFYNNSPYHNCRETFNWGLRVYGSRINHATSPYVSADDLHASKDCTVIIDDTLVEGGYFQNIRRPIMLVVAIVSLAFTLRTYFKDV